MEVQRKYSQKIVTLGGGGGNNMFLRGLTRLNENSKNTAIYGGWDDGSRSGEARLKFGIVPPGDYFMCLYGLMESDEQERVAMALLNDRTQKRMLRDLIAVRAERMYHGHEAGTDALRTLFRVQGDLINVTNLDVRLLAETKTGKRISGETKIDKREDDEDFDPADVIRNIYFDNVPKATQRAIDAIMGADKIVIPPGSPYTSIFPHLKVQGIAEAIMQSKAKLIIVPNLTTAPGEDIHLKTIELWLQEYQHLLAGFGINLEDAKRRIDYLVANSGKVDSELVKMYDDKGQVLVKYDVRKIQRVARGIKIVRADLIDREEERNRFIRHDSIPTARTVLELPYGRAV